MDTGVRNTTVYSGPFVQACMQCFKSKCRCVARRDGAGCERCFRLKRQCVPSDSARKRGASRSRVVELESKIDALLAAIKPAVGVPGSTTQGISGISLPTSAPSSDEPLDSSSPSVSQVSEEDAQLHLETFRTRMLPYFPLIDLKSNVTYAELVRARQFMCQAIIAVTTLSTPERLARGQELIVQLVKLTLTDNQSSIDLLLGCLIYVAWSNDPFVDRVGTLPRLITLSMALVSDLRLGLAPDETRFIGALAPGFRKFNQSASVVRKEDVLEQQRAVLACFILSSVVSSYFAQTEAMRWTPQMEESLQSISRNKECSTDQHLATQVRLQVLAQKGAYLREQESGGSRAGTLPELLYIQTRQNQLQELKLSLPPDIGTREMIVAHAYHVGLCINELALPTQSDTRLFVSTGAESNSSVNPGFERLECLWRCVDAIKSWFDIFRDVSPKTYCDLPFLVWAQLIRCIITLKRLFLIEDPSWNRQAMHAAINLLDVLQWLSDNMMAASREVGETSDDDMFRKSSRIMSMSRNTTWEIADQMRSDSLSEQPIDTFAEGAHLNDIGPDHLNMVFSTELDSEEWFRELFGLNTEST